MMKLKNKPQISLVLTLSDIDLAKGWHNNRKGQKDKKNQTIKHKIIHYMNGQKTGSTKELM